MGVIERPYQEEARQQAVAYFNEKKKYNGLLILPTGSGKSVVIANTAKELPGKTVIFQPSKEILEQNFSKFISYGYRAGIYSASAGMKYMDNITFATIGSVAKKHHLFERFQNIIIDECHLVNPKQGMYNDFLESLDHARVLGLTATPYRLASSSDGAELRFLTRQSPRVFNKVLYAVQNKTLFDAGYLAKLEYYNFNVTDRSMLRVNATGTDFTEASMRAYYRKINFPKITIEYANRMLVKRKNLLVFCALVVDAYKVMAGVPGSAVVTGDTPMDQRTRILADFRKGKIRCVINVGVLTTGFDYPALEAILIARSTMSLGLYYQMIGRCMRPFEYEDGTLKTSWICDLGGNIPKFGRIETMQIVEDDRGLFSIWNGGTQLTNVPFNRFAA